MEHKNKVELVGYYGGDETHALSAWTSTNRELTDEKRNRIDKLLSMLASHGHETPFEKSTIHFLVTSDVASHIHILKHRIGVSVNSESARYKELRDDKFYVPLDWPEEERQKHIEFCEYCLKEYHDCLKRLTESGFDKKRAKESARLKLPYSNQLTCDVMFNFRSFVHFLRLRYSEHSQVEIRSIAHQMLKQVSEIPENPFKLTMEAFGLIYPNGTIIRPFK